MNEFTKPDQYTQLLYELLRLDVRLENLMQISSVSYDDSRVRQISIDIRQCLRKITFNVETDLGNSFFITEDKKTTLIFKVEKNESVESIQDRFESSTIKLRTTLKALIKELRGRRLECYSEIEVDTKNLGISFEILEQLILDLDRMWEIAQPALDIPGDFERLKLWDKRVRKQLQKTPLESAVEALDRAAVGLHYNTLPSLKNAIQKRRSLLTAHLNEIQDHPDHLFGNHESPVAVRTASPVRKTEVDPQLVFVVHGRDEKVRESVELFLHRIGLRPIVLFREVSSGRVIIEKFEHYADRVGYAVILLTPEDVGYLKPDYNGGTKGAEEERARQNVVFEMGFFFSHLGRGRVAALQKGRVSKPSDIDGIVYIQMKDGDIEWKVTLAKEMLAAGLSVDMTKI